MQTTVIPNPPAMVAPPQLVTTSQKLDRLAQLVKEAGLNIWERVRLCTEVLEDRGFVETEYGDESRALDALKDKYLSDLEYSLVALRDIWQEFPEGVWREHDYNVRAMHTLWRQKHTVPPNVTARNGEKSPSTSEAPLSFEAPPGSPPTVKKILKQAEKALKDERERHDADRQNFGRQIVSMGNDYKATMARLEEESGVLKRKIASLEAELEAQKGEIQQLRKKLLTKGKD